MNVPRVTSRGAPADSSKNWPKYCLLLLGISVTLYLNILEVAGFDIRPVQLGPVLFSIIVILTMPLIRKDAPRIYFALPTVWACYILIRHGLFDDSGGLVCIRTLINVATYLAALNVMLRTGRINWLLAGLLIGAFTSVCLSSLNISLPQMVTTAVRMGNGRWQGLMPGANRFANLCAIALSTSIGLFLLKRRIAPRLVLSAVIVAALLGLAMSGSRGATLTTVFSLVLMLWVTGRVQGRVFFSPRIILSSITVLVILAAVFIYSKELLPERLVALIESPEDAFAKIEGDSRRDLFEIAYENFLQQPIFGAGASAAVFTIVTRSGEIEITSHNMYLHFLATSGMVGLMGYLSLPLILIFRLGRASLSYGPSKKDAESSIPLAISWLVLILIHGFVISIGQTVHVWLFYSAAAAICIEQTKVNSRSQNTKAHGYTQIRSVYAMKRRNVVSPRRLVG